MPPRRLQVRRFVARSAVLAIGTAAVLTAPTRFAAPAHVYYVSPSGYDGNSGQSVPQAFRTIGHCAQVVQPGDTCLLESGTYHETVTPATSGTAEQPITFTADAGAQPVIDGADPISGTWTQVGSTNVYTLAVTLPVSGTSSTPSPIFANQIFSGTAPSGVMLTRARWPTQSSQDPLFGLVRAQAQSSPITTTIVDSSLPARDWTGATIHQWGQTNWTAQTGVVTASTTGQITFTTSSNNCPQICATAGTKYYLDTPPGVGPLAAGQWSYDGSTHQLSVWMPAGNSPGTAGYSLEAKQRTWAFDLSGVSHVTISHVALWAASITTTSTSAWDTLDAITATYLSHYEDLPAPVLKWRPSDPPQGNSNPRFAHVLDSGIVLSGTHHLLENSVISESAGNGVVVWGGFITVTNNLIHDTDYGGSYAAPVHIARPLSPVTPDPLWITHNTIYNTARDGINDDYAWTVNAGPTTISQNDVWTYGVLNNDLGGIRDCCQVDGTGAVVTQNWVHDQATPTCVACYAGTGIYLDNGPRRWTVTRNVVWNTQTSGIIANTGAGNGAGNAGTTISIINNTLQPTAATAFDLGSDPSPPGITLINNLMTGTVQVPTSVAYISTTNLITTPVGAAFVNLGNRDYRLGQGSPAIGYGSPATGTTPAGVARPDVGAYDTQLPDWVPGCGLSLSPLCQDPHVPGRHAP
jgi:hypothetical protein